MKNILKKITTSLLLMISISSYALEENYVFNVELKKEPRIINTLNEKEEEKPLKNYQYVNYFDISKSGYGTYSDENRTVLMPSSSKWSSPTDIILKTDIIKEARIKFKTVSGGYANGICFFDASNNKRIVEWYNHDNKIYIFNESGSYSIVAGGGGALSDIMDLRYNMENGTYQFYVNGILATEGKAYITNVNSVYGKIFEGSNSISKTMIIPEE